MFNFEQYCLNGEVWCDVPGYESIYQASNLGRIRSVEGKKTYHQLKGERVWRGRILKPKGVMERAGHRVSLWKDGQRKDLLVARIVCMTFHGVVDDDLTVNHKDGNRFNNHINNLEWLTIGDNIRHGYDNGLYPTRQVKININGIIHNFRSMSEASVFIGRDRSYISKLTKQGKELKDSNGNIIPIFVGELKKCHSI